MGVIIVATLLCLLNIILWIVFAAKFKKIFSTDDIIEKTRDELNHMIADVNRNADRNITLIDAKIKELKSVTAEAERRLALERSEQEKHEKAKALAMEAIPHVVEQSKAARQSRKVVPAVEAYTNEQAQGDLFSSSEKKQAAAGGKSGDFIQKIPIVVPQVYLSDNPVTPKKNFNTIVKEKYDQGESVEDIAAELGRSTQEVQFSLEFS